MWDDDFQFNIDDIHFAPPIPAPGSLALLVVAALAPRRRRRGT